MSYPKAHAPVKRRRGMLVGMMLSILAAMLCGCGSILSVNAQEKKMTGGRTGRSAPAAGRDVAVLANGCFWCTEAIFKELKGVETVEPGYTGGHTIAPTYEQVLAGTTGHAESLRITFDPKVVSYHDLLAVFFSTHDPTTRNRQGPDVGTQYRSGIFYRSPEQKATARKVIREVEKSRIWPAPIVTEVTALRNFYPAEEYHRDYFARNPDQGYCRVIIAPKVAKFREQYREKLKR